MTIPSLGAAILLSVFIIILCIVPSLVIRSLISAKAFEGYSKTHIKKVKKQIPLRARISLLYLLTVSNTKAVKRRIGWAWMYWILNFCYSVLCFLFGLGVIPFGLSHFMSYTFFAKRLVDVILYIVWLAKSGNYKKR